MEQARWRDVERIFQAALERPRDRRQQWVDDMCGADRALRREVDSLLEAHELAERSAKEPALSVHLEPAPGAQAKADDGSRIGPYSVLRELGTGGMGTVYLGARADDEFERLVAIKLMRSSFDARLLSRFRTERQILADLEHPYIARLYEGGTDADGVPYLVMEHVDGVAIDAYCDRQRLPIAERLTLVRRVCDAVAHAHSNLVVHRDIKPSNILITAGGEPKLLDFGIAKLLAPAGDALATTGAGGPPLTPAYASPEQLRGETITTATDIYALGVLLYVLLTGRLPYDPGLSARTAAILEDRQPARPSVAAATAEEVVAADGTSRLAFDPPAVAAARGTRPQQLRRQLAGDLDAIVLRALRHDPAERYATVEQLADDLDRHIAGQPVRARRGTLGYRAAKFVRRHRLGVAVAAGVLTLVVGTAVALAVMAARIAAERDKARSVTELLIDFFEVADPAAAGGDQVTVRQAMDRGAASMDRRLGGQPEVRASLLDALARIYTNLGLYDRATPHATQALELRRAILGPRHAGTLESLVQLADVTELSGDFDRARALREEALPLARTLGDGLVRAELLADLARDARRRGALELAEARLRQALAIVREAGGERAPEHEAHLLTALGQLLHGKGLLAEAETTLQRAVVLARGALAGDDPGLLPILKSYALVLATRGRIGEAETLYGEVLGVERAIFGPEHPKIAYTLNHLGGLRRRTGDLEGAEALVRQALEMRHRLLGADHPAVGVTYANLANIQCERDLFPAAEVSFDRCLEIARTRFPPGSPELAHPLLDYGRCLMRQERYARAEPLLREALELRRRAFGGGELVAAAARELGRCLIGLGRHEEAETLLAGRSATPAPRPPASGR